MRYDVIDLAINDKFIFNIKMIDVYIQSDIDHKSPVFPLYLKLPQRI